MKVTMLVECLLPIISLLVVGTTAAIDPDSIVPVEPTDNCWDIQKFSVPWFTAMACRRPQPDKCLFYGQGLSKTAWDYARANGLMSIWDIWDGIYYSLVNVRANTMRCIMADKTSRLLYFEWMSKAMAELCTGDILYMTADPAHPDSCGFFGQFEYPRLVSKGKVTSYTACDPSGGQRTPFPADFHYTPPAAVPRRFARDFRIDTIGPPFNATEIDEAEVDEFFKLLLEKREGTDTPASNCDSGTTGAAEDVPAQVDATGPYAVPW